MVRKLSAVVALVCVFMMAVGLGGYSPATEASTLSGEASTIDGSGIIHSSATGPIIIDHTCTDLSKIPDYWLEEAKKLAFHYAHTSHGGQIVQGMSKLEQVDSTYSYYRFTAGSTPPSSLPCPAGDLCMYDGNPPETYITPDDYWKTSGGMDRTRDVADTGLFDYSMWSWCGQASSYSEADIQQYIDAMVQFETEYPSMRFILMTGHTDGGSATLDRNNDAIRQYAIDNDMVLFDFADIETYDPLGGGPYDNNGEGTCTWCASFCDAYPAYCTDLPSSCSHSSTLEDAELFCKLKGNAFWWMMARLAGWSGPGGVVDLSPSTKTVSRGGADVGEVLTYTIRVASPGPSSTAVSMTDVLPAGLSYVPQTLTATLGTVDASQPPTLTWSGLLTPTPIVTVTYAATVGTSFSQVVSNTASLAVADGEPISRTAIVIANPIRIDLPLVLRGY